MEVVVRTGTAEAELDVRVAPVGDRGAVELGALVALVTGRPAAAVVSVDGRPHASTTPLDATGMVRGSVIDAGGARPPDEFAGDKTELVVTAGAGAGRRRVLPPGRYRLGPGSGAVELGDGSVRDSKVEIDLTDRTARVLDLDDRVLLVRPCSPAAPAGIPGPSGAGADGTAPFNRPPRPAPGPAPTPLEVPERRRDVSEPRRFPLLAVLAPFPASVALAAMLGHWRYLLLGLMSPLMVGANWVEERRARSSERRRSTAAEAAARRQLRTQLAQRHQDDLDRARRAHPAFTEVLEWMHQHAPQLWSRRHGQDEAFVVPVGIGHQPWTPLLVRPPSAIDGVDAIAAGLGPLPTVPITADLSTGGVGLLGPPDAARPVGAGIVLALAALHGPADLEIVVCAAEPDAAAWEWVKWLPHARRGRAPAIITDPAAVLEVAQAVSGSSDPAGEAPAALALIVADGARWWHGRDAPLRRLLDASGPARLLAVCEQAALMPASCSTLIHVPAAGRGVVEDLTTGRTSPGVALNRADAEAVLAAARALGRLHDPEQHRPAGAGLPTAVALAEVVGLSGDPSLAADSIARRWGDPARAARSPIGLGPAGPVVVDLVTDGPHGLVAGTTGAGKSELLRTLVTGLAVSLPPDELNVLLVDFKGGAAFDACTRLPHTVGVVTDLDDHLAARMLRCLRAELTHRERVLRAAGAPALEALPPSAGRPARLLVVIDEFAVLVSRLADFVPGLIDLAQRGRSLGVHLLLATQRPAGVVDAKIRANTNLRIALRVQDDADSLDVVGSRDAALIPRDRPGRAVTRFGAGELVEMQTALTTAQASRTDDGDHLVVAPFVLGRPMSPLERRVVAAARPPGRPARADLDLAGLVDAIGRAARGRPAPRRPYVEPLPDRLDAATAPALVRGPGGAGGSGPTGVAIGLEDRPDEQRQVVREWQPHSGSGLALYGMAGSGTSSTLVSLALGLAGAYRPDDVHLYLIDGDAGRLAPLAALPHTGAFVRLDEPARLARLVRLLSREIERRRRGASEQGSATAGGERQPTLVVFLDNVGSARAALEHDHGPGDLWASLERVLCDGSSVGIACVVTATTERALPPGLAAHLAERLVFRLPDRAAYAAFGFRPTELPDMVPGRALCAREHTELQVVAPPPDLAAAVAEIARGTPAPARRPAARVDPLPSRVDIGCLVDRAAVTPDGWRVPVGIDLHDGHVVELELRPDAPLVIAGPAGSGRSTVLEVIATAVRATDPGATVYSIGRRPGRLDALGCPPPVTPADVAAWADAVLAGGDRRLLLVDDADHLDGPSFERLAASGRPGLIVVVAGSADGLRRVGHWSRPWLRRRRGILLAPNPADGDVLGVNLPGRLGRCPRGQGLLVDADAVVPMLCAAPSADTSAGDDGPGPVA